MRIRDDKKQEALILAVVTVVNEMGFAASSVAKIAKEAKVSPATLYIYHKNKEELLVAAYLEVKKQIGAAALAGFDENLPVRECLFLVWRNLFDYMRENRSQLQFTEQFANSPYAEKVNKKEMEAIFAPVVGVVQRGISEKIIKNVDLQIITAFIFSPIMLLSHPQHCQGLKLDTKTVNIAFQCGWDAIKA